MKEWVGVDLDRTLAHYDHWRGETHVGDPIVPMVERVLAWRKDGIVVKIVTARVGVNPDPVVVHAIQMWCIHHLGEALPVTCSKDYDMIELWDDRAVQVIPNTGLRADGVT